MKQAGYIVQNKDALVLRESTAGGFFTALAKFVIEKKGIVFGVELDENLVVKHTYAEKKEDLWRFRNSKYVQSNIDRNIFLLVQQSLIEGRLVLFSGTPCQIEGLKSFLNKDYPNLLTVDVVCRAVPSPLVFKKYVEYESEAKGDKVKKIIFRDKHYGYKYSTLNLITDNNAAKYHRGVESDPWLRAYFSDKINRPSCYNCRFKYQSRVSDFTIWDCFQVGRYTKELDNDKGATRLLIHSTKGERVFEEIKYNFNYISVETNSLVRTTHEMFYSVSSEKNGEREALFKDLASMSGYDFFNKNFTDNICSNFKHAFRMLFVHTGLYGVLKKLYVKVTGKY